MNFDDYQNGGDALYRRLAELVRDILRRAAEGRADIPKVQAYQAREKRVESLRRKLENRKLIGDADIGGKIKDLAGARVILYTNIDVNRYLQARLVVEALTVHWEETKAQYPSNANDGIRYEGFHYVVSLPDDIAAKPEHTDLKDLRCEVQIQTLLAHAFAESSHDIIYKGHETPGFGGKLREEMQRRLTKTVDELLKPAGYELDKVQADFENLRKGIELFDRREIEALSHCADNNERFDRLTAIVDHLLPLYDDVGSVIGEVHRALLTVAADARKAKKKPRTIEGYELEGQDADDVMRVVLRILSEFRCVDVEATLQTLIALYRDEGDAEVRKQILEIAEKLASYNLAVWRQVGPGVQLYLGDALAKLTDTEIDQIRPLAITLWRGLLSSEIDGTSWSADAVTISRGAISAGADIGAVRALAIKGLTGLLDRSASDEERRPVISAFWEASQLPYQANYSNELLATAIRDISAVADALLPRLKAMGFGLWESVESHLYREYKRFKHLAQGEKDDKVCRADAEKLVEAVKAIRDTMNRNRNYVRFKTLVGFEGVFSQQWNTEEIDYGKTEKFRKARAARFVNQVNESNADRWLSFIRMCAATKSDDMATFPIFAEFLDMIGEQKPALAIKAIETGESDVLNFLPTILAGLSRGRAAGESDKIAARFIEKGEHLAAIARYFHHKPSVTVREIGSLLQAAIKMDDSVAVIECLALAIATWPTLADDVRTQIFLPAVEWLTVKKDTRWPRGVWFMRHLSVFFKAFDEAQAEVVLGSLLYAKRIDHQYERVLTCIGTIYPRLVWAFFRDRLLYDKDHDEDGYSPIPFQFHELQKVLGADPVAALEELRKWFRPGDNRFQFTGGRLLHATFQVCTPELAAAAMQVCKAWSDDDIEFCLDVFGNYRGEEPLHDVAKALVMALPEDDRRLSRVAILLENTGVVMGEYGMAQAMHERKTLMTKWLGDDNGKVKTFAERAIRHLDNRIATETRDADMQKEQRKRNYE